MINKKNTIPNSDEMTEILEQPPKWLLKWGLTFILMFLILCIGISYFIKYPEVVKGRVMISSISPSVSVESKSTGKIILLNNTNDSVSQGQIIAYIESPTVYNDFLTLKEYISTTDKKDILTGFKNANPNLKLGSLSLLYKNLLTIMQEYETLNQRNINLTRINNLQNELKYLNLLKSSLKSEEMLLQEQIEIVKSQYKRDSLLFSDRISVITDIEQSKTSLLRLKTNYEEIKKNTTSLNLQIQQNINRRNEEETIRLINLQNTMNNLSVTYSNLLAQVVSFEDTYLLKAPITGILSFFAIRTNKQFVFQNQELFKITPTHNDIKEAVLYFPVELSAKVSSGQKVNIKVDNYSYLEFGMLQGIIRNISPVAKDGFYNCLVTLDNGLVTNYKKVLSFKQDMEGTAEIITDRVSLLEKIFYQIKSRITNY